MTASRRKSTREFKDERCREANGGTEATQTGPGDS